jgi:predicted phosphodiesterase
MMLFGNGVSAMALYGVLGDIHGNREALRAVLACCSRRGVDGIICIGDIVGYNAESDGCAALLRDWRALAVAGNHDLISIGRLGYEGCANPVIYSLKRTRRSLSLPTVAYLRSLPFFRLIEERVLVTHAGVRDVRQRGGGLRQLLENAAHLRADFPGVSICLHGQAHAQRLCELDGARVRELPIDRPWALRGDRTYFVNPGSVDAARKAEHKLAEFAFFDSESLRIEFNRTAYDDIGAEARAIAGGYRIDPWTDSLYSLRRRLVRLARGLVPISDAVQRRST